MNKFTYCLFFSCLISLLACDNKQPEIQSRNKEGIHVNIDFRAGETLDNYEYLSLPFNLASNMDLTATDSLFVVLGSRIGESHTWVRPIAKLTIEESVGQKTYIISQRVDQKRADFNDLITEYASVKWMVEQYLTSYKGIGAVRLVGWESYKN